MALLRDYHDRVGEAVFAHGGSIDEYIGDGLMATFGTPVPLPAPASAAVNCAMAMVAAISGWNHQRDARDGPPVEIGIGLHIGEAIVGDIGNARRIEFAVIGDVVNVASRIERLTRDLHSPVAANDALVGAARAEGDGAAAAIARLGPAGARHCAAASIRSRSGCWIERRLRPTIGDKYALKSDPREKCLGLRWFVRILTISYLMPPARSSLTKSLSASGSPYSFMPDPKAPTSGL